MSIGPILGYIFMAIMPFSFYLFKGERFVIFGITPPEVVLIIITLYFLTAFMLKLKSFSINSLDWIITSFVFLALIPVVMSTENLYVAARDYRHLLLTPLFSYLLLQVCFEKVKQMNIGLFFATAIIIIGTAFTLPYYIKTGNRFESGFNVITLGVMFSWSVSLLFLTRNGVSNIIYKIINYIICLYMLVIIFFIGSRAVIIGFVISCILSIFIIQKKIFQKLFLIAIVSVVVSFYFSIMAVNETEVKVDRTMSKDFREVSHSVFRITSMEHWVYDFNVRLAIWKKAISIGLENPILGSGASEYRSLYLSTPHNIFISVFLTSGILGVLLFLFLIVTSYSTLFAFDHLKQYPQITKFFFISLSTLLFVGATNDFSGGRYLLFFLLISGMSITNKISNDHYKIEKAR